MPDYFTLFSTAIPYTNESQRDWLLKALATANPSPGDICEYEDQPREHHIWVYAETYGNPDLLAVLVATFQREFQLTTPWILSWALSCSRPVLDSFSGGALCVYRGTTYHCIPELLIQDHLKGQGWEAPRPISEIWERVVCFAQRFLSQEALDPAERAVRWQQTLWLDSLLDTQPHALNHCPPTHANHRSYSVTWTGNDGNTYTFLPSQALESLLNFARSGGLDATDTETAQQWWNQHSNAMNHHLHDLTTQPVQPS